MNFHDHDDLPYCGVRAMQAQQYPLEDIEDEVDDEETIPISYNKLDFPLGCLFSFPIKISSSNDHLNTDDSEANVGSINPVRICISKGAKLHLKTATLNEPQSQCTTLYVSSDQNPDFLPLYHFHGESSCSLGLEMCGPAEIYLAASSFIHFYDEEEEETDEEDNEPGYVNIFGTIDAIDDQMSEIIFKARQNLNRSTKLSSDDILLLKEKKKDEPNNVQDVIMVKQVPDRETNDTKNKATEFQKPIQPKRKRDDEIISATTSINTNITNLVTVDEEPTQMMSKKQRKKLAKQKAKELEDVLAKERADSMPPKNHPSSEITEGVTKDSTIQPLSKPLSQTRERRLEGGILVRDIIIGTGDQVRMGRKVSITYVGSFPDTGKIFDKNVNKKNPLVFRLGTGEVIKGLERGIDGMRVGGERSITIPPEMGYGKKGMGKSIPGNTTLHFTIQLINVGGGG